jgi:type IV pilus biogenesis protein CpaD/CtpE
MIGKYGNVFILVVLVCLVVGCSFISNTPTSNISIQALQTREFGCSYKDALAAVVSVFHDLEFSIQTWDRKSGIVTAQSTISSTKSIFAEIMFGKVDTSHMSYTVANAHLDQIFHGKSSIRLSFVCHGKDVRATGFFSKESNHITDPEYYRNFFETVDKNIFVRQNLRVEFTT